MTVNNNSYVYFWSKLGVEFIEKSIGPQWEGPRWEFSDNLRLKCLYSKEFCAEGIWGYFNILKHDRDQLPDNVLIRDRILINFVPESWQKLFRENFLNSNLPDELSSIEEVDLILILNGMNICQHA